MAAEDSAPTELMTCSVAPVPPRTGAQVSSPTCDDSDMGAGWRPDRSTPLAPAFCIPTAPQPASLATNNKTFESGVAQRDRELTPGASCEQAPWVWADFGGTTCVCEKRWSRRLYWQRTLSGFAFSAAPRPHARTSEWRLSRGRRVVLHLCYAPSDS